MTNQKVIYCNVQTFTLRSMLQVVENGKIQYQYPVLISELGKEITMKSDLEGIHRIILTGNTVYCEEVKRLILEENIKHYNNELEMQIDIIN